MTKVAIKFEKLIPLGEIFSSWSNLILLSFLYCLHL